MSIVQQGDLDLDYVNEWIGWVLRSQSIDIYRMKGILAIRHAEQKYVYQAVHMQFDGCFDTAALWGRDEVRCPLARLKRTGHPPDRKIRDFAEIISTFLATPLPLIRQNLRFRRNFVKHFSIP